MLATLLDIGGLFVGVVGTVLAILFYLKSRKFKAASYSIRSFNLLTNSLSTLPKFSAIYKDTPLANLTATKILLWNSGSEILSRSDIAQSDPIRIMLPDEREILYARVVSTSVPTNRANIEIPQHGSNICILRFEYLAPKEGCLISLLHTGGPDDQLRVEGMLKGFGAPRTYTPPKVLKFLSNVIPYFSIPIASIAFLLFGSPWVKWPVFILALFAVIAVAMRVDETVEQKTGGDIDKAFAKPYAPKEFT